MRITQLMHPKRPSMWFERDSLQCISLDAHTNDNDYANIHFTFWNVLCGFSACKLCSICYSVIVFCSTFLLRFVFNFHSHRWQLLRRTHFVRDPGRRLYWFYILYAQTHTHTTSLKFTFPLRRKDARRLLYFLHTNGECHHWFRVFARDENCFARVNISSAKICILFCLRIQIDLLLVNLRSLLPNICSTWENPP